MQLAEFILESFIKIVPGHFFGVTLANINKKSIMISYNCNNFHNILRLFDVLPNFLFVTSETMRDYYL